MLTTEGLDVPGNLGTTLFKSMVGLLIDKEPESSGGLATLQDLSWDHLMFIILPHRGWNYWGMGLKRKIRLAGGCWGKPDTENDRAQSLGQQEKPGAGRKKGP